jgi:hypothetical protein
MQPSYTKNSTETVTNSEKKKKEQQLTEATLLSGSPAGLYSPFQLRQ